MIRVKKVIVRFFLVFFIFVGSLGAERVFAQGQLGSSHEQEVIIVKYALTASSGNEVINTGDLKINNIRLSTDNSDLAPLEGITYEIQKITPHKDGETIDLSNHATYKMVGKGLALMTDSRGEAKVSLEDGFYIVSEITNSAKGLANPAAPVLLRLPVENLAKNGYLDRVYLYPKSSVDPLSTVPKQVRTGENLPKTGEASSKLSGVLMGMLCFAVTIMLLEKKRGGRS